MRKAFVSNLLFLVGLNVLIKPLYVLGIETEVQNRVGFAAYGSYFSLFSFALILNLLPDLGLTNWFNRHTAQKHAIDREEFSRIITLRLLLGGSYIITAVAIGYFIQYSQEQLFALLVLSFNQLLSVSILFLRSGLTGMQQFSRDSVISILDKLLQLVIVGLLLITPSLKGGFKIEWLVWAQTFSLFVTFSLAYFWVKNISGSFKLNYDFVYSKEILKESLPFALFSLTAVLILRSDSVMLERLAGADEAGVYAQGFRLFEAYTMLSYLFAVILLPMFAKLIADKSSIFSLLLTSSNLMLFGSWVFSIFCISFPYEVLDLFYDNVTTKTQEAFQFLMLGCFAFSMQYVYGTLLTADKRLGLLNKIMIPLMIVSFGLNFFLIPYFGASVSAQIHALVHCTILLCEVALVIHFHRIRVFELFRSGISFMILSALAIYFLRNNSIGAIKELHVLFKGVIFLMVSLFLTLITGLINIKNLQLLFSRKSNL